MYDESILFVLVALRKVKFFCGSHDINRNLSSKITTFGKPLFEPLKVEGLAENARFFTEFIHPAIHVKNQKKNIREE